MFLLTATEIAKTIKIQQTALHMVPDDNDIILLIHYRDCPTAIYKNVSALYSL